MQTLLIIGLVVWIVVGVGLLGAMAYSLPLVQELRSLLRRSNELAGRMNDRMGPVIDRVETITDDASHISGSLKKDVEEIGRVVDEGSRSARRIARMAEDRAAEIDALIEVAQDECESTFVSTASVLGGVRRLRDRLFDGR